MSTPIVKSARFIISNTDIKKCPQDGKPEYAFIGRSNVGKSSLINALTNQKKLAQTSATPGKTQLINHFLINDQWYMEYCGIAEGYTALGDKKGGSSDVIVAVIDTGVDIDHEDLINNIWVNNDETPNNGVDDDEMIDQLLASEGVDSRKELKEKKKSFRFIVARTTLKNKRSWDTNLLVALEDFELKESADEGDDVIIAFKLKSIFCRWC